ncbi:MAG: YsnF/AvaK domain-containing protein [Gemmataceae bacterium]|nr:YsnF/AvaK domain-containing protein [Gemmataceae bacterium]
MDASNRTTAVAVFSSREDAQRAVQELKRAGFRDDQIGVAHKGDDDSTSITTGSGESHAAEGAIAGVATGAGVGALWGLGIAAGLLPAIGPVIAGGTLAAIAASAAGGAAAAGIAGALIGMGVPEDEANYYEDELKSGRTVVTVRAEQRISEAQGILSRFSGSDMHSRRSGSSTASPLGVTPASHTATMPSASHAAAGSTSKPGTASTASSQTLGGDASQKIQVREEELHVSKTPVETGEVKVRKEVHTEQRTIQVPVKKEEVVIERHAVSGGQSEGNIGSTEEIRIPVREEQVHVDKTAVVKEEVTVGKRQVQETEQVTENIKKEDVRIEKAGDVDVTNRGKK